MTKPLKNYFDSDFVSRLADELVGVYPLFDSVGFHKAVINKDWEDRELKGRMRHISVSLGVFLPEYEVAVELLKIIAPKFNGFTAMVFSDFVEVHGLDAPDISLDALEHFTRYSSAEFAIRPFIIEYEEQAMKRMLVWSKDENHHIRRLSSEGCRPRLPWAMALPKYKKDPSPVLPILENLKNDESEYVRRSVANNINDLTKDNPDIALEIARSWFGNSTKTDWILKHGMRTLLKKGDQEALRIFGFNEKVNAKVSDLNLSEVEVKIGEELQFDFKITNLDLKKSSLKVGYMVGYVKASDKVSEKIFHVSELTFEPKQTVSFNKKLSFKDLTTRKHYPGGHYLFIAINGKEMARVHFEVTG
ncbi:DNA alkylation repair protein [Reichenbachiella sp. MALMAid0571]|uniref:DNA alkylation repair protein n=1 Tax=Reichenbachiella sp. MALMAid0571 TaxID=3143939 RepID=UPI0032DFD172